MQTSSLLPARQKLQGRFEEPWTPNTLFAINALKNINSTSVQGNPKLTLIWACADLDWRRPDLGLLDISVDDGSNGNLDEILRSFRFSAAASNIHRLFKPESQELHVGTSKGKTEDQLQRPEAPMIRKEDVQKATFVGEPVVSEKEANEDDSENFRGENEIFRVEPAKEERSNLSKGGANTSPKGRDVSINFNISTAIEEKLGVFETEPTILPQVAHIQFGNKPVDKKSPDLLRTSMKDETSIPTQREVFELCVRTTSPRISPRKLLKSTLRKTRLISLLFTKTDGNAERISGGEGLDSTKEQTCSPNEGSTSSPKETGDQTVPEEDIFHV